MFKGYLLSQKRCKRILNSFVKQMLNFDELNMIFGPAHEILVLIESASQDCEESVHPLSFNRAFSSCIDIVG